MVEDEVNVMCECEDVFLVICEVLLGCMCEVFDVVVVDEDDENDENDGWMVYDEVCDDDEVYDDDVNDCLDVLDVLDDMCVYRGEVLMWDARAASGSAAAKFTRANVARLNVNGGVGNRMCVVMFVGGKGKSVNGGDVGVGVGVRMMRMMRAEIKVTNAMKEARRKEDKLMLLNKDKEDCVMVE